MGGVIPHLSYLREQICNLLFSKYSSVFRENRCPPLPKPVYGGNFSHEAVTLKIRSRSPNCNKLLILSNLYRLANLVTLHLSPAVTLKIRSRSPKPNQLFIMSQCYIHANLFKIHPPVHEMSCKQESVTLMLTPTLTPMPTGSARKPICPPLLRWGT